MGQSNMEKKQLFDFMLKRVKEAANQTGFAEPQAFGKWFSDLYFLNPQDLFISDGTKDGKLDVFFTTNNGKEVEHHILNTKFTQEYNKIAPVRFYEEITYFWRAFDNRANREGYLEKAVRSELRPRYRKLFEYYDEGKANLMFVTNHKRNEAHYPSVKELPIQIFHLEDLVQHLIDDIDVAMPRTPPILLTGIGQVLSPDKTDTQVATSIVFARLIDFISYMKEDPNDLLFARNPRLDLRSTSVNKAIKRTFEKNPTEFSFSNNGITMLCEKQNHNPGDHELTLDNPRVVNGSQTLHSIRDVPNPSKTARVMVRIIEIPPIKGDDLPREIAKRKDIINKIAKRSNQQNQIKKWNLVANDEFQLDIYRYFRRKKLFYERRENEWSKRSSQLKSVGVKRGPNIKRLAQLIAAFNWDNRNLGPALARLSVSELFDGPAYENLTKIEEETVYQVYLLDKIISASYKELPASPKYYRVLKKFTDLLLLSLMVKIIELTNNKWGKAEFTRLLEKHLTEWDYYYRSWVRLVKDTISFIHERYKLEDKNYLRTKGVGLHISNFVKNRSYVDKILSSPTPRKLTEASRRVFK